MSDELCSDAQRFAVLLDQDDEDDLKLALDQFRMSHTPEQINQCVIAVAKAEEKGKGLDITPLFKDGKLVEDRTNHQRRIVKI